MGNRIISSKIITAVLCFFVLSLGFSLAGLYAQKEAVDKEVAMSGKKITDLEKNNRSLEKALTYSHNPSYLEKQARIQLNYKVADEEVAFVYQDANGKEVKPPTFLELLKTMPNYEKWWYYSLGY